VFSFGYVKLYCISANPCYSRDSRRNNPALYALLRQLSLAMNKSRVVAHSSQKLSVPSHICGSTGTIRYLIANLGQSPFLRDFQSVSLLSVPVEIVILREA